MDFQRRLCCRRADNNSRAAQRNAVYEDFAHDIANLMSLVPVTGGTQSYVHVDSRYAVPARRASTLTADTVEAHAAVTTTLNYTEGTITTTTTSTASTSTTTTTTSEPLGRTPGPPHG